MLNSKKTDIAQNYRQAWQWYAKAAEQNHPTAQYNLGVLYANGYGVAQDENQAREWFEKAAALGDPDAQEALEKLPKP